MGNGFLGGFLGGFWVGFGEIHKPKSEIRCLIMKVLLSIT